MQDESLANKRRKLNEPTQNEPIATIEDTSQFSSQANKPKKIVSLSLSKKSTQSQQTSLKPSSLQLAQPSTQRRFHLESTSQDAHQTTKPRLTLHQRLEILSPKILAPPAPIPTSILHKPPSKLSQKSKSTPNTSSSSSPSLSPNKVRPPSSTRPSKSPSNTPPEVAKPTQQQKLITKPPRDVIDLSTDDTPSPPKIASPLPAPSSSAVVQQVPKPKTSNPAPPKPIPSSIVVDVAQPVPLLSPAPRQSPPKQTQSPPSSSTTSSNSLNSPTLSQKESLLSFWLSQTLPQSPDSYFPSAHCKSKRKHTASPSNRPDTGVLLDLLEKMKTAFTYSLAASEEQNQDVLMGSTPSQDRENYTPRTFKADLITEISAELSVKKQATEDIIKQSNLTKPAGPEAIQPEFSRLPLSRSQSESQSESQSPSASPLLRQEPLAPPPRPVQTSSPRPTPPDSSVVSKTTTMHSQSSPFHVEPWSQLAMDALESIEYSYLMSKNAAESPFKTPSQPLKNSSSIVRPPAPRKKYQRFLILEVRPSAKIGRAEKILRVFDEESLSEHDVYLQEDWAYARISVGDYINIIGAADPITKTFTINNKQGIVILHPDTLISGTTVGESFSCLRRSVLSQKAKATHSLNKYLIHGEILHAVFQRAMRDNNFDNDFLVACLEQTVAKQSNIQKLYAIDDTDETALKELKKYLPSVRNFSKKYMHHTPVPEGSTAFEGNQRSNICVSKVLGIEESIWSPMYGLKGKIDVSVEVKVQKENFGYGMNNMGMNQPAYNNNNNQNTTAAVVDENQLDTVVLPLELKTGNNKGNSASISHRAQVMLYTLLMTDFYDVPVNNSLLYYMKKDDVFGVPGNRDELRGLIIRRNDIATFLNADTTTAASISTFSSSSQSNDNSSSPFRQRLPPTLKNEAYTCGNCHEMKHCVIYHKMMENGNANSSGMGELFESNTRHIKPSHIDYFKHWERLIELEKSDLVNIRKEIWALPSKDRQKLGRCFSCMILAGEEKDEEGHLYTFQQALNDPSEEEVNFLDLQICVGDFVLLSTEAGHYGIAQGFVRKLTEKSVVVKLDDPLEGPPVAVLQNPSANSGRLSQQFHGIMEIESAGNILKSPRKKMMILSSQMTSEESFHNSNNMASNSNTKLLWRIDRDELGTGFGIVKDNLVKLFAGTTDLDQRRRDVIVDLIPPRFDSEIDIEALEKKLHISTASSALDKMDLDHSNTTPTSSGVSASSQIVHKPLNLNDNNADSKKKKRKKRILEYKHLNIDQKLAAQKVLTAQDYALILGMPGTGKTTTITYLMRILASSRKRVLFTAYTHTAVDNLLLKLHDAGIDFLRLGREDSVHADLKKYSMDFNQIKSTKSLQEFLNSKYIIATTCLGITHTIFAKLTFDYCFVDEASQITQPVCLGPIRFAKVFVLVGDHYQLPPLIRNEEAKEKGMEISLFKRLSEAHPEAIAYLEYQYRMNADIMSLSNTLVYNNRLRCGTAEVAQKELFIPNLEKIPKPIESLSRHWVLEVLDPKKKVLFLNTDYVPAPDSRSGEALYNNVEATLVHLLVNGLLIAGVHSSSIGVISPYRAQLKIIRHKLGLNSSIEVHTVDKFQGRDKDCVIISLVRSNVSKNVGDLLRDWRRVNVAFTRAKRKIIIIGSRSTLQDNLLFSIFFDLISKNEWNIDLPFKAHLLYDIPVQSNMLEVYNESQTPQTPPTPLSPATPPVSARQTPQVSNIPRNHSISRNLIKQFVQIQ